MRLISLLPSATEMIDAMGLSAQLVGISHACDYPPHLMHLPRVTSCIVPKDATSKEIDTVVRTQLEQSSALYDLDIALLEELKPDLILTQALCDVCAVNGEDVDKAICSLSSTPTVVNLEPFTLGEVLDTVTAIGRATGFDARAATLRQSYEDRIETVFKRSSRLTDKPKTVVLDWVDPAFVSGHWMHDLITLAGGVDSMGTPKTPSWTASWEEVIAMNPDVLVIACCGFDVERTMTEILGCEATIGLTRLKEQGCVIHIFDGNALFSRPSLRLVDSLELLAHHLHPNIHPLMPVEGVEKPVAVHQWQ